MTDTAVDNGVTADNGEHLKSREGYHYRIDDYYEVGREKIREYARAVQDRNPAHSSEQAAEELGFDGLIGTLTFVSIPALIANRRIFEKVITEYDVFVQTEQVIEVHKPVVAGDRLITDVELSSVRRIAGKDLITVTNTFSDDTGEVAVVMHTTVVGVSSDEVEAGITEAVDGVLMQAMNAESRREAAASYDEADVGKFPVAATLSTVSVDRKTKSLAFEDVSVGDELPAVVTRITRGDLVNYSGVSGDGNPIHWDENVAGLAKLPDVIAHGMLTIGIAAGYVSSWLGDPAAITRFGARLSSFAIVEAGKAGEVEYTGRVKSLDPETRTAKILVTAKSGGKKIFGLATADVRLS
ncbi:fused (3R)-hydroxyacyl-ACP dehydratase subunits HadA/HadB [Antrihabitans cavernicola]|uniref:(R)-hydratase n=1 Tax=Antrihabitans cavernicola TaxID=2495913 RepID=A0A5A7S9E7_9NOCA|nr:fused (3R)-hydroxyacyl-ACP dehydratase subunits HadA/HadB [Spelaeibacter cavernicola]KAA0021869.1 (R)-hydratase [Spelaeibacter cavernicola]